MSRRTFEEDSVIENARRLEQSILGKFPDGGRSGGCGRCGAAKPAVGRTGRDGFTEVRHLECHPDLPGVFDREWGMAARVSRDATWRVDFDPLSLRPGGFVPVGEPWRQPPLMDSNEYQANTCNVLCVRGVTADEVIEFLDDQWEEGTANLRRALALRFQYRICKVDGTPTPHAKGSGASGVRKDVELKLATMAGLPNVEIVLVTVRKPGMLFAFADPERVRRTHRMSQ